MIRWGVSPGAAFRYGEGPKLSTEEIHWHVKSQWAAFSSCWGFEPIPLGRVTVSLDLHITDAGTVEHAKLIKSNFKSPETATCFENRMLDVTFPRHAVGTFVRVHLVFG
jgi:hypothetical protein